MPAVNASVLGEATVPLPNRSAHSQLIRIGLPSVLVSWPFSAPVVGVVPVDRAVAEVADEQVAAERAEAGWRDHQAHGELRSPWEIRRVSSFPLVSYTSTNPFPGPATSSCLAASCLA